MTTTTKWSFDDNYKEVVGTRLVKVPGGNNDFKSGLPAIMLDFQGQEESTTINRSGNDHCSVALFDSFYLWDSFKAAFTEVASKVPQMDSGGKCCKFWCLNGLNWPEIEWVMALWSSLLRGHFLFYICHCAHLFTPQLLMSLQLQN